VLFRFRELLNEQKKELAAIITAEHGKVLSDALGEVTRGQEVVEFACGLPHLIKGGYSENASTKVDVHSTRQPLGVVGIISPFNFPAMVPMWFYPIAIAAGNTVVLKPSEKVPTAAIWVFSAPERGLARPLPSLCKQGVRGSSPLGSTPSESTFALALAAVLSAAYSRKYSIPPPASSLTQVAWML
jgi:acyl-CoA reductase-like NAD-dependent aldehyde dehydrogenase